MSTSLLICDASRTAALLPFAPLLDEIARAAQQLSAGSLHSPERIGVPLHGQGVLLCMPASAPDVAIHKLVAVQPANPAQALPTIHGLVTVCDGASGRPLCLLDGPELTGRRTAAVSLLAVRTLLGRTPRVALLIGSGTQAVHHLRALQALHPQCAVLVRGHTPEAAQAFCRDQATTHARLEPCPVDGIPDAVDLVIALTTSRQAVYDEPARAGRLVIGVGAFRPDMAELGPRTLADSTIVVDDPAGARHEAGDLLQAGVDWTRVHALADLLPPPDAGATPAAGRYVFKSVGTAAWDLAAARVALKHLAATDPARAPGAGRALAPAGTMPAP